MMQTLYKRVACSPSLGNDLTPLSLFKSSRRPSTFRPTAVKDIVDRHFTVHLNFLHLLILAETLCSEIREIIESAKYGG